MQSCTIKKGLKKKRCEFDSLLQKVKSNLNDFIKQCFQYFIGRSQIQKHEIQYVTEQKPSFDYVKNSRRL